MVRLPEVVRNQIKTLVGPHRMAAFIREAVENELRRRDPTSSGDPENLNR